MIDATTPLLEVRRYARLRQQLQEHAQALDETVCTLEVIARDRSFDEAEVAPEALTALRTQVETLRIRMNGLDHSMCALAEQITQN